MFLLGNYNDSPQTVYLKVAEIYLVVVKKAFKWKNKRLAGTLSKNLLCLCLPQSLPSKCIPPVSAFVFMERVWPTLIQSLFS